MKNFMLKKVIFLSLSCLLVSAASANILLQSPKDFSSEELENLVPEWRTQFTWPWGYFTEFTCNYQQQEAGFVIQFLSFPIFSHNYKALSISPKPDSAIESEEPKVRKGYYFAKPLRYENAYQQNIDFDQLVDLLNNKKFIFYTGAGVSAGTVATMHALKESLKMNNGAFVFLKEAWQNPHAIAQAFADFCESAIYGQPTPAHYALQKIAQARSCCILTENLDLLQHRTGSAPLPTYTQELDSLTCADLQEVEVIVCVGLSQDDRGFLAHYKENNPQGLIIAIDLGNPNYLSSEDVILHGDLQAILPSLALQLT
jgi:NAD-dependent SIR2 family protein deacetylase